jgi:hypothetical protein
VIDINDRYFNVNTYIIGNNLEIVSLIGLVIYVLGFYYLLSKYFDYTDSLTEEKQKKHNTIYFAVMFFICTALLVELNGLLIFVIYTILALFFKLIYFNEKYANFRERFDDLF